MRLAIDLGTNNVRVQRGKNPPMEEPALVTVDSRTRQVVAVGHDALDMQGRTPAHLTTVRPLRGGVIAHPDLALVLLTHCMRKAWPWPLLKPRVTLGVSARSTTIQKRMLAASATAAGARRVRLVDVPLAAALGAGLKVDEPRGHLLIHFGGSTTDVAVIYLGRMVVVESRPGGGDSMDLAIQALLRREPHRLEISREAAERLKIHLGSALPTGDGRRTEVGGKDLVAGLPRWTTVTAEEIRLALEDPLHQLLEVLRSVLLRIPPELAADIVDRGAVLTGGGALLRGLDGYLTQVTKVPVRLAENPETCVLRGAWQARAISA